MTQTFLHGGGSDPLSFRPFIEACKSTHFGTIAIVITKEAETDLEAYQQILVGAGANRQQLTTLSVSAEEPLSVHQLAEQAPRGIFVCGGTTPTYHAAVCADSRISSYLRENKVVFCGTSAGAAIAAADAILGGWRVERESGITQMIFPGAGEGLEMLTVQNGLGLVPFAVDVHASQWGTLTRLIHAVDTEQIDEGLGIDEDTMLSLIDGIARVSGKGQVYRVRRTDAVEVGIVPSGSEFPYTNPD